MHNECITYKNSLLVVLMLMFCVLPSVQLSCLRDGEQSAKFITFGIIVYISRIDYKITDKIHLCANGLIDGVANGRATKT
jgi:hypothetical protein